MHGYKAIVEIEGRVQFIPDGVVDKTKLVNHLWSQVLSSAGKTIQAVRYVKGRDFYSVWPCCPCDSCRENSLSHRIRDLEIHDGNSPMKYRVLENKALSNELCRGKYGIKAVREEVTKKELDERELELLKNRGNLLAVVECKRREVSVGYDDWMVGVTVDDLQVPDSVCMEYELVLKNDGATIIDYKAMKEGVNTLERFVDEFVAEVVNHIKEKLGIGYVWQYKTYPEMVVSQNPVIDSSY